MRLNNVFKEGDTVSIILPQYTDITTIKVYEYSVGSEPVLLQNNVSSKPTHTMLTIVNVKKDIYYLITHVYGFEVVRVGNPPITYFLNKPTLDPLLYTQYSYQGEVIKSGTLNNLIDNIHTVLITSTVKSFIVVEDTLTTLTTPEKYVQSSGNALSGKILLQRGRWQIISLPITGKIKEVFLDKLSEQTGRDITELVDVVSTFPGSVNKYLSFKPGHTDPSTEHNFDLITTDDGYKEINGFWVHCKEWSHTTDDILFTWSGIGE